MSKKILAFLICIPLLANIVTASNNLSFNNSALEDQNTTLIDESSNLLSGINWGLVITGIEAIALLLTIIFMYYQYRKTMLLTSKQLSVMSDELTELRKEIRITTHEDIYTKLIDLYYKYIEYADDLKHIFRAHKNLDTAEVRREYMVFAVLDILYLMYLERDTLDKGLLITWKKWINIVFEEPSIYKIYESVKSEFDPKYIKYIEKLYKKNK